VLECKKKSHTRSQPDGGGGKGQGDGEGEDRGKDRDEDDDGETMREFSVDDEENEVAAAAAAATDDDDDDGENKETGAEKALMDGVAVAGVLAAAVGSDILVPPDLSESLRAAAYHRANNASNADEDASGALPMSSSSSPP
jgi:hypothetical protein